MKIISIVGARPQFVKAAVVSRAFVEAGIDELLVHTGQHYDPEMSAIFFEELGIPKPAANLGIGSASHAVQTGKMMVALEEFMLGIEGVDWVLVYGDTNSTLAGAIVAAKLHISLAHVEAGLRSFNRRMPEEINRVVTDRLSSLLFCPTETSVANLINEGIDRGVHHTGDVMLDATRLFAEVAERRSPLGGTTEHDPKTYFAATVHRAENTDDASRLSSIFEAFGSLNAPVVLPLHPRTRARLDGISIPPNVDIMEPVGYLDMLVLVKNARTVLTDSGGLQKEALWLGVPCVTLRDETEWVETLERGWNQIVGADTARIVEAAKTDPQPPIPEFAEPGASKRIVEILRNQ